MVDLPPLISSDGHIWEPPELWTERTDPRFRDRAPRIVSYEAGDWWFCEGYPMSGAITGAAVGLRFEQPEIGEEERFENVRRGGYLPGERIKDMDLDGLQAEVIYPTAGFRTMSFVADSELLQAICVAYNDWVADFCSEDPERLKAVAIISLDDIDWGIQELQRCRKMGLVGPMIPTTPMRDMPYSRPEYDKFWAVAQDLNTPISLHVGTGRPTPGQRIPTAAEATPASRCVMDSSVRMSLGAMIFGRVFERFPKLMVGSIEFENGWAPYFVEQLDYEYTQRNTRVAWPKFDDRQALPSDFFRRNVFISFQEGRTGIEHRSSLGVDTLLWGSDYPHIESTFPRSRQILKDLLADCSPEETAKIVGGNTALIYGIK